MVGVVGAQPRRLQDQLLQLRQPLGVSGIATVGGDDGHGAWGALLADSGLLTLGNTGTTRPARGGYAASSAPASPRRMVAGASSLMLGVNPALTATQQIVQGLRDSARPHVTSP